MAVCATLSLASFHLLFSLLPPSLPPSMPSSTSNHLPPAQLVLNLTFMEAVKGCTKQVPLRVQATCERCLGSGGEPGTKEQTCPYCRGRGEVREEGAEAVCYGACWSSQAAPHPLQEVINTGLFHMKSTCRACHGQGKIITTPCTKCGGRGTTTKSQHINVQVPAGVSDGQTVRVPVGSSEAHILLQVSS